MELADCVCTTSNGEDTDQKGDCRGGVQHGHCTGDDCRRERDRDSRYFTALYCAVSPAELADVVYDLIEAAVWHVL